MIQLIQYKLIVEDHTGYFNFEYFTCKANQDVHNEYYLFRFIQEHKNIRFLPKSMTVEESRIKKG